MIWPATYSRRTVCPECHARIRLEDVKLTPSFPCPFCEKDVCVSGIYLFTTKWLSWAFGMLIAYLIGARGWWLLLWCIVFTLVVAFLWAYIGKYLIPPRLSRVGPESNDIQRLGLGPK
jgi:hypothetical protein